VEIPVTRLIADQIGQNEFFHCPECESPLYYTVVKQFPGEKVLIHYAGDTADLYNEDSPFIAQARI